MKAFKQSTVNSCNFAQLSQTRNSFVLQKPLFFDECSFSCNLPATHDAAGEEKTLVEKTLFSVAFLKLILLIRKKACQED